ncbi:MAG: NAD-dependent epimerase/dehydratase family protein [Aeriscardovia sp.]|nr:NAD-dependent epimerase/dehydratase family protein [Aeriscardovia sp.]MBP3832831.1 NAD-dependent epimerase/dehydratase family protein [Bacteroidaceae bacterium]
MKILITGVHGYIGSYLVEALKDDHVIYGLDIFSQKNDGIENTFHWIALDDLVGMELDAVIHLDNYSHNSKSKNAPYVPLDERADYTRKIFDYFLASNMKKFIFLSSVKAVATEVGDVLTEDVVPSPHGPFGESKLASENYILSRQAEWETKSKEVYILRPCIIHGPESKGGLNLLYNVVCKGIPWPLGSFDSKHSFTFIDNLCFVMKSLLTLSIASGIYNMADDEAISNNRLIALICKTIGKKPCIWHVSKSTMYLMAQLGDFLHLPLNTRRLLMLTQNFVVDNAKIKSALCIEHMPVRAKDGLERTVKSFN